MNRFAFRFLVSLLTLLIGVGSSTAWNHYWPSPLERYTGNQDYYGNKQVRIRAILDLNEFGSESSGRDAWFTVFSRCEDEECAASVKFEEDVRRVGLDPYRLVLVRGAEPPPQSIRFADVVIVGTLDPPDDIPHCWTPKYSLRNARIERVINKFEFGSFESALNWVRQIRH